MEVTIMAQKILVRTDKNGTKYYHCTDKCLKCGGTGMIDIYRPINGGECFDCWGSGIAEWDEKEYTPEYEEKLRIQREKRAAKKLAEEKAHAAEKNAEFFQKNGFNPEGKTYVVLGNTFEIKEELKAQGAKWDSTSRHWHMPTPPEGREYLELTVDDMYEANYAGVYEWNSWKRVDWSEPEEVELYYTTKIEKAENALKVKESTSQHVGEVGEKLDITVTYVHTASWENGYGGYWNTGVTNLHSFKDEQGNVYVWKTGLYIEADYGTKVHLRGSVKEHSEYNGIKQTVLTRCKVEAV